MKLPKNIFTLICLLIIAFVVVACSLVHKNTSNNSSSANPSLKTVSKKPNDKRPVNKLAPKEFGFEFRYGVGGKNVLNTFNATFTRDMVIDKPITVKLKLSEKQLTEIQNKIIEVGLLNYPNKINSKPISTIIREQMPFETYHFKIRIGSEIKELTWEDKYIVSLGEFTKIRELTALIKKTIQDSPEYKKIPESRGGYD